MSIRLSTFSKTDEYDRIDEGNRPLWNQHVPVRMSDEQKSEKILKREVEMRVLISPFSYLIETTVCLF